MKSVQILAALAPIVTIIAVVLLIAVVILSNELNGQNRREETDDICMTPICIHTASRIMSAMNAEADPCDNFYEYACGSWTRNNPVPGDRNSYRQTSVIERRIAHRLRGLLEADVHAKETEAIRKVKTFYKSCMDFDRINKLGATPIKKFITELGGWPTLGSGESLLKMDLEDLLAIPQHYQSHGAPFITFMIIDDYKNSSSRLLAHLTQAILGLTREFYLDKKYEKYVKAYKNYLVRIAVLLGATQKTANKDVQDIINMELRLANITMSATQFSKLAKNYNKWNVSEWSTQVSDKFDWRKFLNAVVSIADRNITDTEMIATTAVPYLSKLPDLLLNTPRRVVVNYVIWNTIAPTVNFLGKEFKAAYLAYKKVIQGTTKAEERWRYCSSLVNGRMSPAVGRLYVDNYFHHETKEQVKEMVKGIRTAMKETILSVAWMDKETRITALEKLKRMETLVGYPDYILDNQKLNNKFSRLNVSQNSFLQNSVSTMKHLRRQHLKTLQAKPDRKRWFFHPAVAGAYYHSIRNQIGFTAGILQEPFLIQGEPRYINYGGLGMIVGHEITHAFDTGGRSFDETGSMRNWWSNDSLKSFLKKTECVVQHYNKYTEPTTKMKLNGRLTVGENVADIGGVMLAYKAYRRYVEMDRNGKEEQRLPGLDLTPSQLLYLSFAQSWCGHYKPSYAKIAILTDKHSLPQYRVIGSLSNNKDFGTIFKCPMNSAMNPQKKCKVW